MDKNHADSRLTFALSLAIVAMCLLTAPSATLGQTVRMPQGVSRPVEALQDRTSVSRNWKVWTLRDKVVPRISPDPSAQASGPSLPFLAQSVAALRYPEKGVPAAILLCETDGLDSFEISRLVGWVDESDLLLTNVAMPIVKEGKSLPVHRKGMAVITQKSLDKFKPRGVPAFETATTSAPPQETSSTVEKAVLFRAPRLPVKGDDLRSFISEIPLSSFYFVYAETSDFVLVGTNQRFKPTAPGDVVLGWLPRLNHADWNNRVGYEWNAETFFGDQTKTPGKRLERGFVFRTAADAVNFLQNKAPLFVSQEPEGSAFSETISGKTPMRLADSSMRMPLLDDSVLAVGGNNSPVAKVGWLGGRAVDEQAAAVARRKIDELAAQSRRLDVMFLIDHTKTMEAHFPAVADAVNRIVTDLRKNYLDESGIYERQMRVSISFYGDETTAAKAVIRDFAPVKAGSDTTWSSLSTTERLKWSTRTDLTVNDMLAELPSHPTSGGGGIEEDVMLGALMGIKKFPSDESRKLLFLIGDMGDKSLMGEEFKRRRNVIAARLANERSPIWFVALHVSTASTESANGKEASRLFYDQMQDVVSETHALLKKQEASAAELDFSKVVPLDAKPPTEEILRAYNAMQAEIVRYQKALRNADPSQLTRRELARLAAQKISLESIRHPLFAEGFVTHYARPAAVSDSFVKTEQISRRVLLSNKDLDDMKMLIGKVLYAIDNADSGDAGIGELLRKEIASIYGESQAFLSLKDAFELRANIRVNSPIFRIPLEDIGKIRIQPKDVESLRASYKRIVDIQNGIAREWEVRQNPANKTWEVYEKGRPITHDRSFRLPRDPFEFSWYWLRENELP